MDVSLRYLGQHLAMVRAMARLLGSVGVWGARHKGVAIDLPSAPVTTTVGPLPSRLIDDFVRFCGGDPRAYAGTVPPMLYPQWGLPAAMNGMCGLTYPMLRAVNAGTTVEMNSVLPRGVPLQVSARVLSVDESDMRVFFDSEIVTGSPDKDRAVVATFQTLIRKPRRRLSANNARQGLPAGEAEQSTGDVPSQSKTERWIVPYNAQALVSRDFGLGGGRDFAFLTGDFNPVHWLAPYARALGFRRPILHGFATAAFAVEALIHGLYGGDVTSLRRVEMRFTHPLVLPARATVYRRGESDFFVGKALGAPAAASGRFAGAHSQVEKPPRLATVTPIAVARG